MLYCCVCAWFSAAVKLFVGNESEFYDRKNRSKNEINGKSCNTIPDLHKHPSTHLDWLGVMKRSQPQSVVVAVVVVSLVYAFNIVI